MTAVILSTQSYTVVSFMSFVFNTPTLAQTFDAALRDELALATLEIALEMDISITHII